MAESPSVFRRLRHGWLAIAARFGAVQTQVVLGFFYFLMIGPFSIATRLARRDFLGNRGLRSSGTAWREADTAPPDLERAKLAS